MIWFTRIFENYGDCVDSEIGEIIFMFLMVTSLVGFRRLWHCLSQASDGCLTHAPRPPPLPDPPVFSVLNRWYGVVAFILSVATFLEVDDSDSVVIVGSGFGPFFDCLVMFLAVCSLVGSLQLFWIGQAPDTRRAPSFRPPPHPDPVESQSVRRHRRKEFLDMLRSMDSDQRLSRRRDGIAVSKALDSSQDCFWRMRLVYSLPAAWVLSHLSADWSSPAQWVSVVIMGWLGLQWVTAIGSGGLKIIDALTMTQSGVVTSSTNILATLANDVNWFMCVVRQLGFNAILAASRAGLHFGWSAGLQTWSWTAGLDERSGLVALAFCGDLLISVLCRSTSYINLFAFLSALDPQSFWCPSIWRHVLECWVFWVVLCPPLPALLKFLCKDVPAAFTDGNISSLARDLGTLLRTQVYSDWTTEEEHAQSLTEPLPPLPVTRKRSSSRSWMRRLLQACCLGSLLHQGSLAEEIHYVAAADDIGLSYGATGSFTPLPDGWRHRRRLRNISRRAARRAPDLLSQSQSKCMPTPLQGDASMTRIASWVHSIHPALEGRRWLAAQYLDKVVMQRLTIPDMERVLVNLSGRLRHAHVQAFESVFNSLSQQNVMPLIVDSGASCCISPRRDDFVTYGKSDMKIKDLSGVNKVAGEGMIRWKVLDKYGREYEIQIKGYHIPQASVRLLSPQCIIQTFKGSYGGQTSRQYVLRLADGTILEAPYTGQANLPLLRLSNESMPTCFWAKCFSFTNTTADEWSDNVLAEANLNLSSAQKELLRWHQRLSHAGLSTIHNLCRQKRNKIQSEADLIAIRDAAILPCTFNVPSATCDGLLCAACATAKAARRSPTIRPTTKAPDKEMILKKGDVAPGDRISCDHFISPVKGRVVNAKGYSSSNHGVTCGTLYADHATGWIFVHNQKSTEAPETIRGKLLLEREASDAGVRIRKYHADNGVFSSVRFKEHCEKLNQKLSFSGVGAKFQNGVAERGIQTVSNMARANMLHATMRWPGRKFLDLWPFAIQYAVWVHNHLPPNGAGWSPTELWNRQKNPHSPLSRAHVFGCPVYVLDAKLQDGKKIPKWDSRARQGIFVGFSNEHSTLVPLVLNPKTQHISPQYHVIFDDDFATVPAISTEAFRNQEFARLFEFSRERYVDPSAVGADPALADDAIEPPSMLLDDEWLSEEDLAEHLAASDSNQTDPNTVEEGVSDASQVSEGALVPEGALDSIVESGEFPIYDDSEGDMSPYLHDREQRPRYDSSDDDSVESISAPRPRRHRDRTWKDGPVHLRANTATVTRTWSVHSALRLYLPH